ncbi:MAG: peptide/nickel transport system permease protein [Solirubrobacteraceae bacterium]
MSTFAGPLAPVTDRAIRRRRLRLGNSSLRVGVALLTLMLLLGIVGPPFLVKPTRQDLLAANLPPGSAGHLLGTDALGRDVLSWIASAVVVSLIVSASVVVLSSAVGTVIGLLAGYKRGVADSVLMRLVDLSLAIPPLVLFVTASVKFTPSLLSLVLLLSSVSWIPYARLVRAKVLSDRERGFIAAARLAGVSTPRILLQELLPNAATLLLVMASLQAGYVFLWRPA